MTHYDVNSLKANCQMTFITSAYSTLLHDPGKVNDNMICVLHTNGVASWKSSNSVNGHSTICACGEYFHSPNGYSMQNGTQSHGKYVPHSCTDTYFTQIITLV